MDSDAKIDMINAYRQLTGQSLKLGKSIPEGVVTGVNGEFQTWVKKRIEELLGASQDAVPAITIPATQFTEDDVNVLLALIDNVRSKQKLNTAASGTSQETQPYRPPQRRGRAGLPDPKGMRPNPNAKPLVEQIASGPQGNDRDGSQHRDAQGQLLRELANMDRGFEPD